MSRGMTSLALLSCCASVLAAVPNPDELVIAEAGRSTAVVAVNAPKDPNVPSLEWKAAEDLAKYIGKLSGATPSLVSNPAAVRAAKGPVLVIGELALKLEPSLRDRLRRVAKKNPVL